MNPTNRAVCTLIAVGALVCAPWGTFGAREPAARANAYVVHEDAAWALHELRQGVPLEWPVNLETDYRGEEWGTCEWDGDLGEFTIRVHADVPPGFHADVVAEEYAHAVVWDAPQEDPHGPLWGVAYARCVRLLR